MSAAPLAPEGDDALFVDAEVPGSLYTDLIRTGLISEPSVGLNALAGDPSVALPDGNAIFESETFAGGVCLNLSGEHALPDNFFDLWPGVPYVLPWAGAEPSIVKVRNLVAR